MPPWQTVVLKRNVGESWQGLLIIIPTLNWFVIPAWLFTSKFNCKDL